MVDSIRDFLGTISGYKQLHETCIGDWRDAQATVHDLTIDLRKAQLKIKQLEDLVPHPAPPKITSVLEKDSIWVQQVIDELGAGIIRLPLDSKYRLTNEDNFLNIIAWDWVDVEKYQKEVFDCEQFAIAFKSHVDWYFGLNQVGIVIDYQSGHAYNLVIYPDGDVSVLEPQQDALYIWEKRPAPFYTMEGAIVLI